MDKGFHLQSIGTLGADPGYLVHGKLPGQNHPAGPLVVPELSGSVVGDPDLGGHVELDLGGVPLGQGKYPHVAYNKSVYSGVLKVLQILRQGGELWVSGHGVAGHMDRRPVAVAQLHRPRQLLPAEIAGEGPHTIHLPGQIDGVCAVGHRHLEPFHISGGGEKLNTFIHGYSGPEWQ